MSTLCTDILIFIHGALMWCVCVVIVKLTCAFSFAPGRLGCVCCIMLGNNVGPGAIAM